MKSDSEEYRHLCECASIMAMPFNERRPRLERIEKARGRAAVGRIKLTLMEWKKHESKLKTVVPCDYCEAPKCAA